MPIPDYQSLMLPVLEVSAKGESSVPLAADEIAGRFGLTNEEREQMLTSGKQRVLHNRIHWAKFYLTKAGLLESPKRGRFMISNAGRQALALDDTGEAVLGHREDGCSQQCLAGRIEVIH